MPDRSASRTSVWLWLACLALPAAYAAHCWAVEYVSDDGYIAFQYVRNLLRGEGLVYNPGERVEGYNNFLWMILLAGTQALLPKVPLLRIAQGLGVVFGVATIISMLRFSARIPERPWPFQLVGAAFLAAHAGFAASATSGLETTLTAFLLLTGATSYVTFLTTGQGLWRSSAIFALAALAHPDGAVAFLVTTVHAAWMLRKRTGRLVSREIVTWLVVFAAIYVPYYVWRFNYYGYPLPNTAYAKVGTGLHQHLRGIAYLARYLAFYGGVMAIPGVLLLLRKPRAAWRDYFALLVAGQALYIIYVGGDGLAFFRFVVYIAPVGYLLVQEGLADLYQRVAAPLAPRASRTVLVASVLLVAIGLGLTMDQSVGALVVPSRHRWYEPQAELSFPGRGSDHDYKWFDNYFVERLARAARWLDANSPRNAVIASTPAGSIAFHMDRYVIDMLGLNDVHIAHSKGAVSGAMGQGRAGHEKGDGKYVLARSPDYILMGNVAVLPFPVDEATMAKKLVLKSEEELWADPEFHRRYELVCVPLADAGLFRYFTFYRKKNAGLPPHLDRPGQPACPSSR